MDASIFEFLKFFISSSSYNNQWMVVDYKLFKKGEKELSDNLLWIIEQIPYAHNLLYIYSNTIGLT